MKEPSAQRRGVASLAFLACFLCFLISGNLQSAYGAPDVPPKVSTSIPPIVPTDNAPWARLQRLLPTQKFDSPVALTPLPAGDNEVVIAQQRGLFQAVKLRDPRSEPRIFLDLRERMREIILFEEGVHGIAFHPRFRENGLFYISYTQNRPRRTVISEMKAAAGGPTGRIVAQPETERVLLEEPQPLAEHWGGQMTFGPDGMLYIGIGDGGIKDDPYRLAQNPWSLHGKILRICVDKRDGILPYSIPKDNPFVGRQVYREEIFALGFRNPWGLSFDAHRGDLWCADVGGELWEEVNRVVAGGNYGWSDREGPQATYAHPVPLLTDTKPIEPVHTYSHFRGEGICIVGGVMYRGNRIPQLAGCYVFGDWGYGWVAAIELDASLSSTRHRWMLHHREQTDSSFNPTYVATDDEGEIVVLSQEGNLWTLIPQVTTPTVSSKN